MKLLVTILLVSLVPLLVSGFLSYRASYNGIYNLTVYDLRYITSIKAGELSQYAKEENPSSEDFETIKKITEEVKTQYYQPNGMSGYAYLINSKGVVVYHPDKETDGKDVSNEQFIKDILAKKTGYIEYLWYGKTKVSAFEALPNGWTIVVGSYLDDLMKPVDKIKSNMLLISFISSILAVGVGLFIILQITRPIKQLVLTMKKAEEGDLTVQVPIRTMDEIGQQSSMFNQMMQHFRSMLAEVHQVSEQVAASSEQLTASANESSKASDQISVVATEIASGSEGQMEKVHTTSKYIHDMSEALKEISENVKRVNKDSEVATQYAHQGKKAMSDMMTEMGDISNKVRSTEEVVRDLDNHSEAISGIITTIREISEQTNLLALNAAIEAARAGEQGRSFAVVAQEIRKLAEQSSHSAEQIANLIHTIRNEISRSVIAMEQSSQAVKDGLGIVEGAGKAFTDILKAIEDLNRQIEHVTVAASTISDGSVVIVEQSDEISKLAEKATADTEEVAAASQEQSATMQEITAASETLARMAEQLQSLVNRFKI